MNQLLPGTAGSGVVVLRGSREGRAALMLEGNAVIRLEGEGEPTGSPDPLAMLQKCLAQARACAELDLFMPALTLALTLPDVCAAASAEGGRTSASKYKAWLREHGGYTEEDAELVYGFRCSLLHQGSGRPHQAAGVRIAMVAAHQNQQYSLHWVTTEREDTPGAQVFWMTVSLFVDEICQAVEEWLKAHGSAGTVRRNLQNSIQLYPQGLLGHVHGLPVIA